MRSVIAAIQPFWCGKIASGYKTIEIRKTRPKLAEPFKCYIYCTKDPKLRFWRSKTYSYADDRSHNAFDRCGNGMVIGEFVCKQVSPYWWQAYEYPFDDCGEYTITYDELTRTCLNHRDIEDYGDTKPLFGWNITDLLIYDEPKPLADFGIKKAPQSWCYVKEVA